MSHTASEKKSIESSSKDSYTTTESKDIFPFLDLPRELRDEIYDLGACNTVEIPFAKKWLVEEGGCVCALKSKVTNAPHTNFMLINRQIRDEYKQRPGTKAVLKFADWCDNEDNNWQLDFVSREEALKQIEHVTVRVVNRCYDCDSSATWCNLTVVIDVLRQLIFEPWQTERSDGSTRLSPGLIDEPKLPNLKTIKLSLGILEAHDTVTGDLPAKKREAWPVINHAGADQFRKELEDLSEVDKISEIEVYFCSRGDCVAEERNLNLWVTGPRMEDGRRQRRMTRLDSKMLWRAK